MKVQTMRKLLSPAERPAPGLNLPQISLNAEATQISKRMCRNSGRGQAYVLKGQVLKGTTAFTLENHQPATSTTLYGLRFTTVVSGVRRS